MKIIDTPFVQSFIRLTDDATHKGWHERNGGNLSYRIRPEEVTAIQAELRDPEKWTPTEVSVPELAGEYFLVTGSGKFMRNIILAPEENTAIAVIDEMGENYSLVWGLTKGGRPTSEFPTHLMNHAITKTRTAGVHRVIYHSHPVNAIALTFVLPLEDRVFTRELWGGMTECPIIFPEGVGVVPWMVPGGPEIALATAEKIRDFNVVFWTHHGVFCCGADFDEVFGMMDAVEKSAAIAVKVISMGGKKREIQPNEYRDLAKFFKITLCEEFLD